MAEEVLSKVLLESGTNELEIMEFTVDGKSYGINVAKINTIMKYEQVTPMPNCNPNVEGIFKPRNEIITVINLASYLGLNESDDVSRDIFIITNFNNVRTAFHVHTVEGIHRISWRDIEKPDSTIYGGIDGPVTGIARSKNKLITIIDFEKILVDINPGSGIQMSEIEQMGERTNTSKPLMVVEDSPVLMRMIQQALTLSGYTNLICCNNGQEAWDKLNEFKTKELPINNYVKCIITDIEMPQMDGHHLIHNIRQDAVLADQPIIIFSSIINDEMKIKGEELGATAQISKPEISNLVTLVDKYILD